jgi:PAS domain S-box-containing protein
MKDNIPGTNTNAMLSENQKQDKYGEWMVFSNAMDEVFFSVDMVNHRVIQISQACEKLYGYSQADFLSNYMFWFELIHPDDRHIVEREDEILKRGEQVKNEYRVIRRDGEVRWVENKIIPFIGHGGKLIRVDGITRDITRRKVDEDALRKSEANLRTVFDNTDTAYVLFDTEMNIISFNALAQKFSEEQNRKKLKVNKPIKDYFTEERWQYVQGVIKKVAAGETVSYELSFTKDDGRVQWHEVRWVNVQDSEKQNRGFILANKNITEAKLAALEREKITSDLIQHNKDLEQFTYIISHNLRAPVANIIGLSEMLKEPDIDETAKEEVLDRISQSVKNIDNVIKDLNQILQTRELANEKKEQVYFRELLDAIQTSIYNTVINENVQFQYHFEDAESIFTIRSYLYSIFYNLSSNSIKYHRPGIAPIISIKSCRLKNKVEIRFKDNGKGIDLAKYSSHLFGLYKRFDNSVEGKGMGLFMVKTQVEALGGNIRIKSKPGEGAEFIIQLPV